MKKFDYYQPESLKEAYRLMEKTKGDARYVAGGTDVIVRIKMNVIGPDALISLKGIEDLKGIRSNGGISLGSMTILRDIELSRAIAVEYPALVEAVKVLANPQIRNVATVGGNICNAAPSADCAPPLLVMEANLTLEGPGGVREVSIADFFTGPGETCMDQAEVLKEMRLPEKADKTGMAFLKWGRVSQDIAVSNAAALLVMDNKVCRKCRLAVGAVAPVPLRLKTIEDFVEGQEISPDLLEQVGGMVENDTSPITDVRSTEEYRRTVTGVLVKRAIKQALESVY